MGTVSHSRQKELLLNRQVVSMAYFCACTPHPVNQGSSGKGF